MEALLKERGTLYIRTIFDIVKLILNPDGTCKMLYGWAPALRYEHDGSFTLTDDTLTIAWAPALRYEHDGSFTLTDDTLTIAWNTANKVSYYDYEPTIIERSSKYMLVKDDNYIDNAKCDYFVVFDKIPLICENGDITQDFSKLMFIYNTVKDDEDDEEDA